MRRAVGWWKRNWIGIILTGILAALLAANYFSAANNAILRDRNRYFDEYTEQVRRAREDHKVIMAKCGD